MKLIEFKQSKFLKPVFNVFSSPYDSKSLFNYLYLYER